MDIANSSRVNKISKKQKEDEFDKLPDDIIIKIFTKLSNSTNFKYVCQSIPLVSKRFSSLLHNIPSISVSFPLLMIHSPHFVDFKHLILQKYLQLHSLHIRFLPHRYNMNYAHNYEPEFVKWKANCNPKSLAFVFLSSTFCETECKEQEEGFRIQIPSMNLLDLFGASTRVLAFLWRKLMNLFVKSRTVSPTFKLTCSYKNGMLCFKDDDEDDVVPELRDVMIGKVYDKLISVEYLRTIVKFGCIPVLRLPLSGLVMEEVMVGMFRIRGDAEQDDGDNADDIVDLDFEEGEELFGEAMATISQSKKKLFRYYQWQGGH